MKLLSNFHWPRAAVVVFLFTLTSLLALYRIEAKEAVKTIFESGALTYIIWIYVSVSVFSHNYFMGSANKSQFDKLTDQAFSIATYGLAGTTSITLLQGVFMQQFFNTHYFDNFGNLDLASVGIVSAYLLIYCGINTSKMLGDVVFQVQGSNTEAPSKK